MEGDQKNNKNNKHEENLFLPNNVLGRSSSENKINTPAMKISPMNTAITSSLHRSISHSLDPPYNRSRSATISPIPENEPVSGQFNKKRNRSHSVQSFSGEDVRVTFKTFQLLARSRKLQQTISKYRETKIEE